MRLLGPALLTSRLAALAASLAAVGARQPAPPRPANLALVARASTSYVSGHETIRALNDGFEPADSNDKRHGAYGNWPRRGTQWVEYEWPRAIATREVAVYWFADGRGVRLPKACRLLYWDGARLVPVAHPEGLGLEAGRFNRSVFDEVRTTRLRLEFDGDGTFSTGILEWRVLDAGSSPNFAPVIDAGPDRTAVLGGAARLAGSVRDDGKPLAAPKVRWRRLSGPGPVRFSAPSSLETEARFGSVGEYRLGLEADDGSLRSTASVRVNVAPPMPRDALHEVPTAPYRVTSTLWMPRLKAAIVNWIPYCARRISDPQLREGGIDNFVQAGLKISGKPFRPHRGDVFANAWVYNVVEAMSLAQLVDAQGDREILAAQAGMRRTLADWIPKILSAQEPDGYIQTAYTLGGKARWTNRYDHEGYTLGYLIEAAVSRFDATGGKDARLLRAARKAADCWARSIGPAPRRAWYDDHEELELALFRLARHVEDRERAGKGRRYADLAKFLLASRGGGEEYNQSHLPLLAQTEAVGHAVRAMYAYSGLADWAAATRDPVAQGALLSLWESAFGRKGYVTGGVGSGETSEGFGGDYSLPNSAYAESCAACGAVFLAHRMSLSWRDARYADQMELSLDNAVLGSLDLEGRNFTYTNPLDSSTARYAWHVCPCCVGNIPRTLLRLPLYATSVGAGGLTVDLFVGGSWPVGRIAGTEVALEQRTEYPWKGAVTLVLRPARPVRFALRVRAPGAQPGPYRASPASVAPVSLRVNGRAGRARMERGYAVLERVWRRGDRVDLSVPLPVRRVRADPRVAADRGRVALVRGPIVYSVESADGPVDGLLDPAAPLEAVWRPDLLGGVVAIRGRFADGSPLLAVPNYARLNRGGRSLVWIRER